MGQSREYVLTQMFVAPLNSYVITNEGSYTYVDRVACLAILNILDHGKITDSRITPIPFGEINVDASDIYNGTQTLIFAENDEAANELFLKTVKGECMFCKAEWHEGAEHGISHGYEINHPNGCKGAIR